MSICDPAYETCPADNSSSIDAPVVTAFNPLIYAWGLIPFLDFVAGLGNKHALNSFLADLNDVYRSIDSAWIDITWTDYGAAATKPWSSPPKWFFQDTLVLAQGVAMFSSWAAALFVGGPASLVFLYTSKLDILL